VSELAERAGVAPSTVRFYERAGLLSPARRAENGYRVFDESAVDELAFIGRAKGIGMGLEDIAGLLAVWPTGECRSLQARLRGFVIERISQIRDERSELGAFERQLQTVLGRLSARDPGPDRCGKGCGCEADLDVTEASGFSAAWACSLDQDALTARINEWREVLASALSVTRTAESVQLVITDGPDVVAKVAALCAAEAACCAPTRFVMEITTDQVVLSVTAPDAPRLLDALFPAEVTVSQ
jgi:MerR family copper efflux transcriptional regulator